MVKDGASGMLEQVDVEEKALPIKVTLPQSPLVYVRVTVVSSDPTGAAFIAQYKYEGVGFCTVIDVILGFVLVTDTV